MHWLKGTLPVEPKNKGEHMVSGHFVSLKTNPLILE